MYVSVLIRRLRPDKSYEDFVKAWYPDKGFQMGGRGPILARSLTDEREIIAIGLMELEGGETIEQAGARIAAQEAVRHDRIDEVIESAKLRCIYAATDEFDFSTDETVAAGRPDYLDRA